MAPVALTFTLAVLFLHWQYAIYVHALPIDLTAAGRRDSSTQRRSHPSKLPEGAEHVRKASQNPTRWEDFSTLEVRSQPDDCIWEMTEAEKLKGFGYAKYCMADKDKIGFPGKSGGYINDTYGNCKNKGEAANVKHCQCDHLFEAVEVLHTINPPSLTPDDKKALCKEFPDVSRQLRTVMNGKDNMKGLSQRANTFKTNLLSETKYKTATLDQNSLEDGFAKVELQNLEDYHKRNAPNRQKVAKAMDKIIDTLKAKTNAGRAAWKKIYTSGMFDARRKAGDDRLKSKLPALKKKAEDGTGPVLPSKSKKAKAGTGPALPAPPQNSKAQAATGSVQTGTKRKTPASTTAKNTKVKKRPKTSK